MITLQQAEAIERAAIREGLTVEELIDRVSDHIGQYVNTIYLRRKLHEQTAWLLEGFPEEAAPYLEKFYELLQDPFALTSRHSQKQIKVTIDEFINVHIPAALAAGDPHDS
jgi:hypothetical protein